MEKLLTVTELHALARIGISTIYHLVAEKKIPHVRIGARVFFNLSVVEEWLADNSFVAVSPAHTPKPSKQSREAK